MRWVGLIAPKWEMRNAYRMLIKEPKALKPFGTPRYRCEESIKMSLK
jgi:hypothetical protein